MALFGRRGGGGAGRAGERSRAEREAARLERERRRALREGRTPPPVPGDADPEAHAEADVEPHPGRPPWEQPGEMWEPGGAEQYDLAVPPFAVEHDPREAGWHDAEPHAGEPPHAGEQPPAWDEPDAAEQPDAGEQPQAWDGPDAGEQPQAWDEPDAAEQPHAGERPHAGDQQRVAGEPPTEPLSPLQPHAGADATGGAAANGGGPGERDVEQPTVAFTLEEEHAATTPAPAVPPPPATSAHAAGGGDPGRRTVQLPRARTEPAADGHHYEAPIGTRRGGRSPGGYAPQPGAPAPGHRQLTVPRRRRRRRLLAALLVLVLLVAGVAVVAWLLFQPFKGEPSGSVRVVIPPGATASQIGDRLARAGVVDSGFFFDLRTRLSGHRGDLRAGTYTLEHGMTYGAAIDALTTAPTAAPVVNVTLPEGPSRRELAPAVRRAGVRGDYLRASRRSDRLDPRAYGAPRRTASLEGFLFPSTYQLRRSAATARNLVDKQLAAFRQNVRKVSFAKAKRKNLTVYDVLTIASMIEREARVPRERPLIAAVIYNRLKQGIPLGIDATIRYYEQNWSRPLRRSELERDEPYNTRRRQGLPPTPIGNPGLASIRAAANPARADYLFYVVRPCGNGAHNFSATDAQFQRDVAAYNRKRDELGGKDPSTCKR
ncbi:MAG TPA: endolytic transglycosylase MltG [Solirubrobacteraceae bacterium]|nr:endolytic transglycosylase MltG [Solirubrobacteraceae bacterium]